MLIGKCWMYFVPVRSTVFVTKLADAELARILHIEDIDPCITIVLQARTLKSCLRMA